jgi:hypothetical protein
LGLVWGRWSAEVEFGEAEWMNFGSENLRMGTTLPVGVPMDGVG